MEGIFWPMRALFSEDDAVELARAADKFPNALSKDGKVRLASCGIRPADIDIIINTHSRRLVYGAG